MSSLINWSKQASKRAAVETLQPDHQIKKLKTVDKSDNDHRISDNALQDTTDAQNKGNTTELRDHQSGTALRLSPSSLQNEGGTKNRKPLDKKSRPSPEMRRMLYDQRLVSHTPLRIEADVDTVYEPLGLHHASEVIREEALPFFYLDNTFILQVKQYSIEPYWTFLEEAGYYRDGEDVRELITKDVPSECNGRILVETDDVPHWDNLVVWLSLAHAGKVVPLGSNGITDSKQAELVKDLFEHVLQYKGEKWNVVEQRLGPLRKMLGRQDERWVVEEEDEDTALVEHVKPMGNKLVTGESGEDLNAERTPTPSKYGTADTARTLLPSTPTGREGRARMAATPEDLLAIQSIDDLQSDLEERIGHANESRHAIKIENKQTPPPEETTSRIPRASATAQPPSRITPAIPSSARSFSSATIHDTAAVPRIQLPSAASTPEPTSTPVVPTSSTTIAPLTPAHTPSPPTPPSPNPTTQSTSRTMKSSNRLVPWLSASQTSTILGNNHMQDTQQSNIAIRRNAARSAKSQKISYVNDIREDWREIVGVLDGYKPM